jgi:transglutaminase-like putative cysteine protease
MKRLLIVLTLLLATAGLFYIYTTNSSIAGFLRNSLESDTQITETSDSTSTRADTKKDSRKKAIEEKKKIPKILKPGPFRAFDEYARKVPEKYSENTETLAQYLILPAKTDLQKVRTIFTWIATHIQYDYVAFNSGNYPEQSAENVLATRKAVCMGYSELMQTLCVAANLNAEIVLGYAKGYGYEPGNTFTKINHAWNAVEIDGVWHLFDVTWARGSELTENGKLATTYSFDPFWFDAHPKAFIFTHLPTDPDRQLTGDEWLLDEYERQPYLSSEFFNAGVDPNDVYREARSGTTTEFVDMYDAGFPMKIIRIPYSKNQVIGQELSFKIQSDYAEEIALVDGDHWQSFKKQDNVFTLLHKPANDELQIVVKINWFDEEYSTIAEYSMK